METQQETQSLRILETEVHASLPEAPTMLPVWLVSALLSLAALVVSVG